MRIDLVEFAPLRLDRKERFEIARGGSDVAELVLVGVHAGPRTGYGCAAPTDVTKETPRTVVEALGSLARRLPGFEFRGSRELADHLDNLSPSNPSAKASVDMAVYDLAAQEAGVPLYKYLGGSRDRMVTSMTIGIMGLADAVDRARRWTRQGFRALKVKIGRDARASIEPDTKQAKLLRKNPLPRRFETGMSQRYRPPRRPSALPSARRPAEYSMLIPESSERLRPKPVTAPCGVASTESSPGRSKE